MAKRKKGDVVTVPNVAEYPRRVRGTIVSGPHEWSEDAWLEQQGLGVTPTKYYVVNVGGVVHLIDMKAIRSYDSDQGKYS